MTVRSSGALFGLCWNLYSLRLIMLRSRPTTCSRPPSALLAMLEKAPPGLHGGKSGQSRLFSRRTLILGILVALLLFLVGKPGFSLLRRLKSSRFYEFPPRELFINETDINRVSNRSDVVQPLVGLNDTFDIAVAIWQLASDQRNPGRG